MADAILTQEYLKDRLSYDPETGIFTHNYDFGNRYHVGDRADTPGHAALKGYRLINLLNQKFLAHRCAWLYVHGVWPDKYIDHIDGDRSNNALANLRDVSERTNMENRKGPSKNNKLGVYGVHALGKRFAARITVDYKSRHLGVFSTVEEAHQAYLEAKRKLHKGCTL